MSLSIAQLCFLFVFLQVYSLAASPDARYFEAAPPGIGIVWALILDVLSLAALLFVCFLLREGRSKAQRLLATAMILLCCLFAGYQVQRSITDYLLAFTTYGSLYRWKLLLSSFAAVLFAWKPRRAFAIAHGLVLIMAPLFPIAAANTLWQYRASHGGEIVKGSPAGMLPATSSNNRVIWIIFDELDQRILFDKRPQRVHLDEFDALRRQAIYATSALSPNGNTLPALQSLILGRRVETFALETSDLRFRFQGCSQWQSFASHSNIFTRARAEGFNTALSGWHHPYCRLIGKDLSDCAWNISTQPFLVAEDALNARSFFGKALYLAKWQARKRPFFRDLFEPGGVREVRRIHRRTLEYVKTNGERMLRNQDLNLVVIHINAPHPPGIWDTHRATFTNGASNYVDNLQLANQLLKDFHQILDSVGNWDSSAILITADHPYRPEVWETQTFGTAEMAKLSGLRKSSFVPFLLKLPQQNTALTYTSKFNTVLTSELLLSILRGDVTTSVAAVSWLDKHAGASLDKNCSSCN